MTSPNEIISDLMVSLSAEIKASNDPYLKLDFFKEMVKWAGIKNKIDPDAGEGSKINEYRSALTASGNSGRDDGPRRGRPRKTGFGSGEPAPSKGNGASASFSTNPCTASGSFSGDGRDVYPNGNDVTRSNTDEAGG